MIQLVALSKSFGPRTLFGSLDLNVASGSTVVLAGPSGSGKSTLLRLIAGLEQPSSGRILLSGAAVAGEGLNVPAHLRGVALSFQDPVLWPHMDIAANIRLANPSLLDSEINAALNDLGLASIAGTSPRCLSGGEARRVDLARAVLSRRPFLLLDEPLAHIDQALAGMVLEWVRAETVGVTRIVVAQASEIDRPWGGSVYILDGGGLVLRDHH